ncbi:hypothetical protein CcCBS67573_g08524 [Chytriomyces confervae]|uniref:Rhodanese domain-containing protein n=1 Tax=Chytriomyces confervae TaxID=246404 RepID=A0A507EJI3_9FUNG|nr:hypothetical protein HDU80_004164 [Chytriomyces hyalinus]TPX63972.1 hypothetical protein CcCBS67573_g08524 [Chytriomyces confervae]
MALLRSISHLRPASARLFSVSAPANNLFQSHLSKVKASIKEVSVQDLSGSLADGPKNTFHLFDVRETYEWNQGRIPNAFYTGRGNLERDIETYVPDTHDDIVLYCAGGVRSILAAESLKRMGYKNVSSLAGGIGAWKSAGKPIDAPGGKTYTEKHDY